MHVEQKNALYACHYILCSYQFGSLTISFIYYLFICLFLNHIELHLEPLCLPVSQICTFSCPTIYGKESLIQPFFLSSLYCQIYDFMENRSAFHHIQWLQYKKKVVILRYPAIVYFSNMLTPQTCFENRIYFGLFTRNIAVLSIGKLFTVTKGFCVGIQIIKKGIKFFLCTFILKYIQNSKGQ